jgi:hypothetical protein
MMLDDAPTLPHMRQFRTFYKGNNPSSRLTLPRGDCFAAPEYGTRPHQHVHKTVKSEHRVISCARCAQCRLPEKIIVKNIGSKMT